MSLVDVDVDTSGPLFDGRAHAAVRDLLADAEREVAAQGYADVMQNLDRAIQNPTPYYETQVTTERRGDHMVVTDRGVIYGPWLEGVGSRNRTTRFKGYFSFRRGVQQLREQTPAIVQAVLRRHLNRLGG
jgi:hypothetical protein